MTVTIGHMALLGFVALVVWAAISDARNLTIPNRISGAVAALWLAHGAVLLLAGVPVMTVAGGPAAGLVTLIGGAVLFRLRLVGGGDVKLLAAVAMWAGLHLLLPLIVAVLLAGGVLALVMLAARGARMIIASHTNMGTGAAFRTVLETKTPFGVAIAAGGLLIAYRLFHGAPVVAGLL